MFALFGMLYMFVAGLNYHGHTWWPFRKRLAELNYYIRALKMIRCHVYTCVTDQTLNQNSIYDFQENHTEFEKAKIAALEYDQTH